jgi:sacsin
MSDKLYSNATKQGLIQDFSGIAKTLLLFTQNVEKVKLFLIPQHGTPSSMQEIYSISKEPLRFLRTIDTIDGGIHSPHQNSLFREQCNLLTLASSFVKNGNAPSQKNVCSVVIEITTKNQKSLEVKDQWLVTSCVGQGDALEMARSDDGRRYGLTPCGAVAAKLSKKGQKFSPVPVKGETFCFLPLGLRNRLSFSYLFLTDYIFVYPTVSLE